MLKTGVCVLFTGTLLMAAVAGGVNWSKWEALPGSSGKISLRHGSDPSQPALWRYFQLRNDSAATESVKTTATCGHTSWMETFKIDSKQMTDPGNWHSCSEDLKIAAVSVQ
jgi:hypothetical protein